MIYGLIPQELHQQLLDHQNYQNRTNGVEKLKKILLELDLNQVTSGSITEFIQFLRKLLDDNNFKVLYGTLQVINLLIEKLEYSVDRYYKEIISVTLKTLGDSRNVTRHEYMNVFRQLMRMVGPQRVLDLMMGQLRHKNSRVREDILNIIIAALLTHPRKDFNIPVLCLEAAPTLGDNKKKVRHAALELFAVLDYCLDTGKKQPLMKAIDRAELTGEADGLMAAVQARRTRHVLPRLSPDGMVEYALVLPKPGQRHSPQVGSGADLNWVLNGGRAHSSRGLQSGRDSDQMSGSLGSLTDNIAQQRRIVSAGKNKLPWEKSALSSSGGRQVSDTSNGKSPDQVSSEDLRTNQHTADKSSSSELLQFRSPASTRRSLGRHRRSGSLDSDPEIFKMANLSGSEKGLSKMSRFMSGSPSVERTFSLPSNSIPPGSFLLPSYPLTPVTGSLLAPTLPRRNHTESSLSASNTWPNKREISPRLRRDVTGDVSSSKRSPLPPRTARASSGHRRPSVPPSTPPSDRNLHLYLSLGRAREPEEEALEREEMLNSLRSLRNSAAKKRAAVSVSGSDPDPDSPDSAVKLELVPDSPDRISPSVASPLSESGLSSLCSPPTPTGIKSSPVNSKAHMMSVSSGRQVREASGDADGVTEQDKCVADGNVSIMGQRLIYSNRPSDPDEEMTSSTQIRGAGHDQLRLLRPSKGSQQQVSKLRSDHEMSEGVIGRGVFASVVPSGRLSVTASTEQGDSINKPPREIPSGVYGHALIAGRMDSDDSPEPEEERIKLSKFTREKMRQRCLQQQESNEPMRRHLTHALTHDVDCMKDVGLNASESLSGKTPSSLTQNPVKSLSPAHQPTPPTGPPNRNAPPRLRRTSSLTRTQTRPVASHGSDEQIPETPKKEGQDQTVLRPFSKPELSLTQSFRLLASDDWEKKIEGLNIVRSLALYHHDVLISRTHDVCLVLIQEVRNLRSGVSRVALVTLSEMFAVLQKGMDQELEGTVRALLNKAGETNTFIRQDVDKALDSMVQNCTATRSMNALLVGGLGHLNSMVRKCTAQHLCSLVERVGAARSLSGAKDLTDRLLPAVSKLSQDSSQEARYFGRRMLLLLSSHRDFDKMLEKFVTAKDLPTIRDAVFTLKTKGLGEMPQDAPSARGRRSLPGTSSLTPLVSNSRDCGQFIISKGAFHSLADRSEYIKQMKTLLNSKDFRERIKAIDQLEADCEENPSLVISSMLPVFDALKARLQESNSKVNLRALEALQNIIRLLKDNLTKVLNILIPAIVDNHLNSKNNAIYRAALGAVQALVDNIDNGLLLQPFCSKAQYVSGKAKLDLIEKVAELVMELYPRKPQLVEQKVLPLFWHLLSCSSNSGAAHGRGSSVRMATAKLGEALYAHMGRTLVECAASQSPNIQCDFNELLRTFSTTRTDSTLIET
ncbi:TOG array regulator of axonemal microtubules protein 1 isoform X1 [Triplophysa dalaica]|uniref:TOG array regulator of axonemal microtubules protein 1 isoform X1 n=1 Tax=Triplophysa dalaica TaxID=1582913 RepID=UPI0024DFB571|nr:TOG array regulator of axonemal microtubules protein 1 isoform X1 [Triplophysa dalaica]